MRFYRTTTLAVMRLAPIAVIAGLVAAATPGSAAAAVTLDPIKPCYVAVNSQRSEQVVLGGTGFTPGALVDIAIDGEPAGTVQADANGALAPRGVPAPFVRRGARAFRITAIERGNPANGMELQSLVVALSMQLTPRTAAPSQRVRWRGYGFTGTGRVYAHYVFRGRHKRTVALGTPAGPCGRLSVRRRQFPFRPRTGKWLIQVDQERRFTRRPSGPFVFFDLFVSRV